MCDYHKNIFKGQTKEEIKTVFNQKWLDIINNCTYKITNKTCKNGLRQSDKHDIMTPTAIQHCSANLEKEELNNNEE